MRALRNISAIAIAVTILGLPTTVARATPFQFGPSGMIGPGNDIVKNGTGGGGGNPNANNDASNFFRLSNAVAAYNANAGSFGNPNPLPTPLFAGVMDLASNDQSLGSPLIGFAYAVLHYGVGEGGTKGMGGGVEFFYLNGMSSFVFPANGTGPNGFGGFSSLTLFKGQPGVPDGGTTLMLLGCAIGGLGVMRRFVRR